MSEIRSIGLPVMHKERGEKRAFLPSFVGRLAPFDVDVIIEHGYGEGLGYTPGDYTAVNSRVRFVPQDEVYNQDLVVVLRAPDPKRLSRMRRGASLMSMLHYETRPVLAENLWRMGIECYSLDSIADDTGDRMVVTYQLTASGGMREAFRQMALRMPDFYSPLRQPVKVTIIGIGRLGVQAGRIAFGMGDESIGAKVEERGAKGSVVTYLERGITQFRDAVNEILQHTDLLVDATRRPDPTKHIISNDQIAFLPEHAIVLDLSCDPYDTRTTPIQVKAIEGIPTGTLDQWVFDINDPAYDTIPHQVDTKNRRMVVSCNAWPGVTPSECMKVYEDQIIPLIRVLCDNREIRQDSADPAERALYRSTLRRFFALTRGNRESSVGPCDVGAVRC